MGISGPNPAILTDSSGDPISSSNPLAVSYPVPHLTANFTRPASATQYTAGDHVANSETGASVTPMVFTLPRTSGKVIGARCVIEPASGNLVITAADFDLLLLRPQTNIPFAAGSYPADNAALTLTAAIYREFVGSIRFSAGNWRNPLGALTASTAGYQSSSFATRPYASFNLDGLSTVTLIGLIQVVAAWNPGNVANRFDITLDVE